MKNNHIDFEFSGSNYSSSLQAYSKFVSYPLSTGRCDCLLYTHGNVYTYYGNHIFSTKNWYKCLDTFFQINDFYFKKSYKFFFKSRIIVYLYFIYTDNEVTQKEIALVGKRVFSMRNILEIQNYKFIHNLSSSSARNGPHIKIFTQSNE